MTRKTPFAFIAAAVLGVFLSAAAADAAKVVYRIRVGNPKDTPQTEQVKRYLPVGVRTNDILNTGGLDIGYDVKNDAYYVHREVELGPRGSADAIQVFRVEIRDIWAIPEEEMADLQEHAAQLVEKLKGTDYSDVAEKLGAQVKETLDGIRKLQEEKALKPNQDAMEHIQAYETNSDAFDTVKKDIGRLENMVLGTGRDPGAVKGEVGAETISETAEAPEPQEFGTAVFKITVRNTSDRERVFERFRHNLPKEIGIQDVLDAGELRVAVREDGEGCYVYKDNLKIPGGETKTYEIKIRDRWDVNEPRIAAMQTAVTNVMGLIRGGEQYDSIRDYLDDVLEELKEISGQPAPEELGPEYVAFYRRQNRELDRLEKKIARIKASLKVITPKFGFDVQPPSPKTTWLIIWIILVFLGVMSLLFFLRWFSRTKAEALSGEVGRSESEGPPT
ncbi:MAG: hypothetical protein R6V03_11165 [Kiritimatiellia bacterium]